MVDKMLKCNLLLVCVYIIICSFFFFFVCLLFYRQYSMLETCSSPLLLSLPLLMLFCMYIYYMTNIFVVVVSERKLCYSFQANHCENKDRVPKGVCKV